jgi:outer membrane lipoprotein SlyB
MPTYPPARFIALLIAAASLAGCAATGPSGASARPVLYANATLNKAGDARARQDTEACLAKAQGAGLTPLEKTNEAGQRAGKGAATGAVAGAVGALITGGGLDGAMRSGAGGALIGASVGAVSGAMTERPSATYRSYVQRCLADMGYEVIGWN